MNNVIIVEDKAAATPDEAVNAVARGLGFKATSAQLTDIVRSRIAALMGLGDIEEKGGMLTDGRSHASS